MATLSEAHPTDSLHSANFIHGGLCFRASFWTISSKDSDSSGEEPTSKWRCEPQVDPNSEILSKLKVVLNVQSTRRGSFHIDAISNNRNGA